MTWFSLPFHRMFLHRLKMNRRKHSVIKMTENTWKRGTASVYDEFRSWRIRVTSFDWRSTGAQMIRTAAGYRCKFSDGITTVLEIIQFAHQVIYFTGHVLAYKAFWFWFSTSLLSPGVETARLWITALNFQPKPRTSNISKYISQWCLALGFLRGNII